jgi:hypothetical protein
VTADEPLPGSVPGKGSPIQADEILWRRLKPDQVRSSDVEGEWRAPDGAFMDRQLSVFRKSLTTLARILSGHDAYGVAEFPASVPLDCGCRVEPDDEEEPGHALVMPNLEGGRWIASSCAKKMGRAASIILLPSPPRERRSPS